MTGSSAPYNSAITYANGYVGIGQGPTGSNTFLQTTSGGATAGTGSFVPQYPLDIAGTIRSSSYTFMDNSAQISATPVLDYNTFAQNWTQSNSAILNWFALAISSTGQYQIAAAFGGSIYYSSTYGQTWTVVTSSPTASWGHIAMSASGQYAIICPGNNNISTPGIVYISSTYGQTWTATSLSVNGAVAVSASGQIMAVCNNSNGASSSSLNGIFISTNYGQTWSRTYSATSIYQITMSASGQYQYATFYSGSGDSNYFSTNYGQSWSLMQGLGASLSNTIQGITCSASGQYVIATNGIAFYYSSNYGQTWFAAAGSSGGSYNQISASASGQYIVAGGWGSSNLVYYSTNYGANWTSLNVGITMTTVAISANGEYITGTIGGGLGGSPTGSIYTSITRKPPQLITAQSTASTTGLSILAPNIGTSNNIGIVLGRTVTSNNYATMGFQYIGASSTSNYLYLGANVANTLCITAAGNVGIGLTNPPHTLSAFSNIALPTITTAAIWPCQLSVIGQVAGQMQLKLGSYYTGGVGSYCAIQATETFSGTENIQSLILQPIGGQVGIGSTSIPVACPLYVYSNTNSGWDGRGYFGNATLGFVCGTYNGTVLIGGHNSPLTGWTNITIGAVGTTTTIPGSVVSGTVNGLTLYRDATRLNLSVGVSVNTTNTGNTNIIFGYEVGQNITTGIQNVLMGVVGTGNKITTGNHNTCIGYQAGFGITNGGLNTCIGHQALGNISGTDLSGNYNCGIGHYTLVGLTTGSFNSALGVGAGTGLTTGNYCLYIGTNAQPSAGNNSGEIVICNSGAAVGKGSASCFIQVNQNNMWWSGYTAGGTAIFGAGGQVIASSDRNLKNNITYLTYQGAVQKMLDLKPCTYEFKADKSPTPKVYTGFIAQDVDEVIPTAVDGRKHKFQYEQNADGSPKVDEDGNVKYLKDPEGNLYPRHLGLNTTDILATAVLAIQEQQTVIVDLKTQLVSLKAIVDSLVARQ
ncbi:MAG: hypothetical protein EBU46_08760 [Nitrosomonadaceae bacterium]|nr:hypothetical protein [Nitrosomonadaceae bacterium]